MVYGEDGSWLHDGVLLGGSAPEPPLKIDPFDAVILRSGFALREDDLWRLTQLRDLAECNRCDVASLPRDPIAEFLNDVSPAHSRGERDDANDC